MNGPAARWSAVIVAAVLVAIAAGAKSEPEKPKVIDVPIEELGSKFRLVGKTGKPLGTFCKIAGTIVEPPAKFYGGTTCMLIQQIDGSADQSYRFISLHPLLGNWNAETAADNPGVKSEPPEIGKVYEFTGYETGEFEGIPDAVYERLTFKPQTIVGTVFISHFVVLQSREVKIDSTPDAFVGREALLRGTAQNTKAGPVLNGDGWSLELRRDAWTDREAGKLAEAFGEVKKEPDGRSRMTPRRSGLVRLDDQIDQTVLLRATAWSMNNYRYAAYHGEDIEIEGSERQPENWLHGDAIELQGTLERIPKEETKRREADPNASEWAKKARYVLRKATWKPTTPLLAPEVLPIVK